MGPSGDIFGSHDMGGKLVVLLASSGVEAKVCLTSFRAQVFPPQQRIIQPQVSVVSSSRDPALGHV